LLLLGSQVTDLVSPPFRSHDGLLSVRWPRSPPRFLSHPFRYAALFGHPPETFALFDVERLPPPFVTFQSLPTHFGALGPFFENTQGSQTSVVFRTFAMHRGEFCSCSGACTFSPVFFGALERNPPLPIGHAPSFSVRSNYRVARFFPWRAF